VPRRAGAATRRADRGQALAEFALILSLIVILSIVALLLMGDQISAILSTIAGQL
jgi:Flp pilus assembly pilin Flp